MLPYFWKFQTVCLFLALMTSEVAAQQQCGQRNVDGFLVADTSVNDTAGRSRYGEFPWMVVVLKIEIAPGHNFNLYLCGGSLIHPAVVLTAAHCVRNFYAKQLKVRVGEWDTQSRNEMYEHQDRFVLETVEHADYNGTTLINDVTLLFLDRPVQLMATIGTICLPPADANFAWARCLTSGWGKDKLGPQGAYQTIMKRVELLVVPRKHCEWALRTTRLGWQFTLHSTFLCAGMGTRWDTCTGDGGSPLVCPIAGTDNRYYQAGIVAWGIGCNEPRIPGVYVNMPMFREWIDEQFYLRNLNDNYHIHWQTGGQNPATRVPSVLPNSTVF